MAETSTQDFYCNALACRASRPKPKEEIPNLKRKKQEEHSDEQDKASENDQEEKDNGSGSSAPPLPAHATDAS